MLHEIYWIKLKLN